jgi:hypothetical protein
VFAVILLFIISPQSTTLCRNSGTKITSPLGLTERLSPLAVPVGLDDVRFVKRRPEVSTVLDVISSLFPGLVSPIPTFPFTPPVE